MKTRSLLLPETAKNKRSEYNSSFSLRDKILLEKNLAFVSEKDQVGPTTDLFFHELVENETRAKKNFERVFGFLGFLLFLVTLPVITLFILVTSGRPIFVADTVVGYRGKKFERYLYRIYQHHDRSKLIFFGNFLKATGLYKLPSFYNIMSGSMALVGPQPLAEEESELLNKKFSDFYKRFASKPGVVGIRGERQWDLDQPTDVLERSLEKELNYIGYPTLRQDLKIILNRKN